MAKELPYFRFYVSEWLNDDISFLPYNVKGVFSDVCSLYWFKDCSITKAMLEQRLNDAKDELEQLYSMGIIKLDDDTQEIRIKFLDEQYDTLSDKRKKRVEAGRKGGLRKSSNAKAKLQQSSSYKDKDKDKDKEKDKEKSVAPIGANPSESLIIAKRVSKNLLEAIKEYDSTHKYHSNPPSINGWIKDIDRAIRLDGRTEEQLNYLIEYIFKTNGRNSSFWAGNIGSGKKLRDKFDTIKNQIKQEHGNTTTSIARNTLAGIADLEFEDA